MKRFKNDRKTETKYIPTAHKFNQNAKSKLIIYVLKLINIFVSPSLPAGVG
jgi:hypothetical protein